MVGQGVEATWLRHNMQHAEFTGVLTGKNLSRAFANMDLFVFPSETDTFGLAVLEAFSSGVPAIVTAVGGPKYTVQHGKTGYIANNFDDFVIFTELLLTQPVLMSRMGYSDLIRRLQELGAKKILKSDWLLPHNPLRPKRFETI
jgi:glycosyltransferase involved in cell wall biosynthesis